MKKKGQKEKEKKTKDKKMLLLIRFEEGTMIFSHQLVLIR